MFQCEGLVTHPTQTRCSRSSSTLSPPFPISFAAEKSLARSLPKLEHPHSPEADRSAREGGSEAPRRELLRWGCVHPPPPPVPGACAVRAAAPARGHEQSITGRNS
eukprot:COSAG02_NODE_6827_length_3340_cov_3.187905_1_plen_106_part_00